MHGARFGSIDDAEAIMTPADELLDDIFANLYSNSVKYTEGELVEIETSVSKLDGFWKISIGDKGRGISNDKKANLFNRYSTNFEGQRFGTLDCACAGHSIRWDYSRGRSSRRRLF